MDNIDYRNVQIRIWAPQLYMGDCEQAITVFYGDIPLGTVGLSRDLSGYYQLPQPRFVSKGQEINLDKIVQFTMGKPTITLIQSIPGSENIRRQLRWHALGVEAVISTLSHEDKVFLIPSHLNFWLTPLAERHYMNTGDQPPKMETLIMHYNATAKRCGFKPIRECYGILCKKP